LFAYDAQTLKQLDVFMTTPTGEGGGLWQGAAAPAADAFGDIYLAIANGTFDANVGGPNHGETLAKLMLVNGSFKVLDSFTPFNKDCLNLEDLELGSAGPTLLPEASFSVPLLVVPNKEGRVYVLNRNALGGYRNDADNQIVDWLLINAVACNTSGDLSADGPTTNRIYGSMSYFNGSVYVGAANTTFNRYTVSDAGILTLASNTSNTFQIRGAASVISAEGTSNAILWTAEFAADTHDTILRAYDATDLSNQLYNSTTASADSIGRGVVFTVPVVVNGKVYVGSEGKVSAFGLK
jgi:hypothetical protein